MKTQTNHPSPTFDYEQKAIAEGYQYIAGADEAGRGPLAGPVVAAAVILPHTISGDWVNLIHDSKEMKESDREACFDQIKKHATAFAIVEVSAKEIDEVNILQASLLGMKRSVEQLSTSAHYLLVDGKQYPPTTIPGEAIIKGDQKSLSISAASILAKVTRDRIMYNLHNDYPQYGWKFHKGYPTKYHRIAIRIFGSSPLHRMSFNGVKNIKSITPIQEFHDQYIKLQSLNTKQELKDYQESLIFSRLQLSDEEYFYLNQSAKYKYDELILIEKSKKSSTKIIGDTFEDVAAEYLQEKGYRIVNRNYHTEGGEIDIVAETDNLLVFVEVKARRTKNFGTPHEAVSKSKINKIITATVQYLYEMESNSEKDIRYDVISIYAGRGIQPEITHIEDAFRSDDMIS